MIEIVSWLMTVAGYVAVPAAVGAWGVQRWRSRIRNASGRCAVCGAPWEAGNAGERFLIHGRLVCESCAARARGRLGWQLGLLGGAAIFSSLIVLAADGPTLLAIVPPALVTVFTAGAIGLMKLANRRARNRIHAGTYPLLHGDEVSLPNQK